MEVNWSFTIPELPAGQIYLTAPLAWHPPASEHYGMLARLVTPQDPMTVLENADVIHNTKANNNIAWRNYTDTMAVTVNDFKVTASKQGVNLEWETTLETDHAKFTIWRGNPLTGATCTNNPLDYDDVKAVVSINAQGTVVENKTFYSKIDSKVIPGKTYCYLLQDTSFSGDENYHGDFLRAITLPTH